jgi:hypothetical protein
LGANLGGERICTALNGSQPHRFDLGEFRSPQVSTLSGLHSHRRGHWFDPVSPTQVTGPVRDLRAGPSPLYSRKVQLRPHPASASAASAGVCRGCGGAGPLSPDGANARTSYAPAGGADPVAWGDRDRAPLRPGGRRAPAHRTLLRTRRAPVQCPWQPGRGHLTTRRRSHPPTGIDRSLRASKAMPTIPRSVLPSTTRSFTGSCRAR